MKLLLYILLITSSCFTFAQKAFVDIAISASTVTDADQFTYKITTDCDCDIEAPDLSDFNILQKMPGQSHATSTINGITKSSCTSTLTYVLRAKKKGKYNISEAVVHCKNSDRQSEKVSIEVVDSDAAFQAKEGNDDFYYKITSSKESVITGEPFLINFFLYTTKKPKDIMAINSGSANGAWRQNLFHEMASDFAFPMGQETVKGKQYFVIYLRKEVCIASEAGTLNIEPYFGRAVKEYDYMSSSYFEGFSNSLEINVKKPPLDTPEHYYGMVGDFELVHEITKTQVKANRAIELTLKISGTGNFQHLQDPSFVFPESFLVSDPEYVENLEINENGVEGDVTYTFVITPTKEGTYSILPYSLAFYSLKEKRIKQLSTEAFSISVTEGEDVQVISNSNDPLLVEDDIRYIHSDSNHLFQLEDLLFGTISYYLLLLSPLSLAILFILLRRKKSRRSADEIVNAEKKLVKKSTSKDINELKKRGGKLDSKQQLRQLKAMLDDYLMSNLRIGRSGLGKHNIVVLLEKKGLEANLVDDFKMIWDKLELAQFSQVTNENTENLLNQTDAFLNAVKDKI